MTTPALIMMIIALLLVWGGLVVAIIHLRRHPEEADEAEPVSDASPPAG
ncbi:methionine/alanine import family NSS transporter small subunit [Ruania zhangjianzhongii]|nr:methionine/alanine import family NSS transporter small subunit [Ruania zhangjianzhongii]